MDDPILFSQRFRIALREALRDIIKGQTQKRKKKVDAQLVHDVHCTAVAMLRDGIPRPQIVAEISEYYKIPPECVEEAVAFVAI